MNQNEAKQTYQDALTHWKDGRFAEALRLFEALEGAFPNNRDIVLARARCLKDSGDLETSRALALRLRDELNDARAKELLADLPAGGAGGRWSTRRRGLVAAGGVLAFVLLWLVLGNGGSGSSRNFTIPRDVPVGTLYQRPADREDAPWEPLGEARGSYSIPYSLDLRLIIPSTFSATEVEVAIKAIQSFPVDTFQEIDASDAPVGDIPLVRLARLSEVLHLNLRNTGITDAGVRDLFDLHALASLDVSENPGIGDSGLQWLLASPGLTDVNLSGTSVAGEGLAHARALQSLRRLRLPESATDDALRHVGAIHSLVALHAPRSKITDEGVAYLRDLDSLQVLDLSVTPLTNAATGYLGRLTALRELRLAHTRIGAEGVSRLRKLQALETLDLTGTPLNDSGGTRLALLTNLQVLTLKSCCGRPGFSPVGLEPLVALAALRQFDLTGHPFGADAVPALSALHVGRLVVTGTGLSESDAAALREAGGIGEVVFDGPGTTAAPTGALRWATLDGDAWRPVADADAAREAAGPLSVTITAGWQPRGEPLPEELVPRIRRVEAGAGLVLDGAVLEAFALATAVTDVDLSGAANPLASGAFLEGLPDAQRVSLRGANGTDDDWAGALPDRRLLELDVSASNVGTAQMEVLGNGPGVERLVARATTLGDGAIDSLSAIEGLSFVDVRETAITAEGSVRLAQALPNATVLTTFSASETVTLLPQTNVGTLWSRPARGGGPWSLVGDAVGTVRIPAGHELRLVATDAFIANVDGLASSLGARLVALNLAGTGLSDTTAGRLASFPNLRSLDVSRTAVGNAGLEALAPLIALETLDVGNSRVTDSGMPALDAFPELTELDLSGCSITDNGLASASTHGRLRAIYAEGTAATPAGVANARAVLPEAFISITTLGIVPPASNAPGARILVIPQGPSPGMLSMRPWDGVADAPWTEVGPLCCETPIPAGMALRLDVDADSQRAAEALAALPPGTFHTLRFAPESVISAATLEPYARFTGLRRLVLDFCAVEAGGLSPLARMTGLESLSLYRAKLDDASLADLRNAPWIASIGLGATGVDDDALGHLASVAALADLDVHGNGALSDAGLARTALAERVTSLNASRTGADAETFDALKRNSVLAEADVYGTAMPKEAVTAWAEAENLPGVNATQARFNDYEVGLLADPIQTLAHSAEGITSEGLADIADVESLDAIATESLRPIQRLALSAMAESDTGVTTEGIAEVAGAEQFGDIPLETLPEIQHVALSAMAESDTGITTEGMVEVAGTESFDAIQPDVLPGLQSMALSAMADSDTGVTSQGMAEISGAETYAAIPGDTLPGLQTLALSAMAESDTGITPYSLAQVAGAESMDTLDDAARDALQRRALSAMADSDTGITSERVARLVGADNLEALDDAALNSVRAIALSAMEASDTGITVNGIAELGNAEDYEEMQSPTMDTMQHLTLSAMANSETGVTSERLATAGGREVYASVPEVRLDTLQRYALSAMTDSDTGITTQSLAELGGVETFAALAEDSLASLQVKALSAMADSDTGITREGIAVIAGVDDVEQLSDEQLLAIQSRTVTALAESRDGIRPEALREFVGDAALRNLSFAGTDVRDEDVRFVSNLSELRSVDFTGCKNITDATLEYLSDAPVLDTLIAPYSGITDMGMRAVGRMKRLRELNLAGTAVTDSGLQALRGLTALEVLSLRDTDIEGSGLRYLAASTGLTSLDVAQTRFWDGGALHLAKLTSLEELNLGVTDVSDTGLAVLGEMRNMRVLDLYDCPQLTSEGMAHLFPMQRLSRLTLNATFVSEEASPHLQRLGGLKELYVNQQMFTQQAAYELGQAMPECLIRRVSTVPLPRRGSPGSSGLSGRALMMEHARDPFNFETIPTRELVARFGLLGAIVLIALSALAVPFGPYILRNELAGRSIYGAAAGLRIGVRAAGLGAFYAWYFFRRIAVAFWWIWLIAFILIGVYVFIRIMGYGFDTLFRIVSPGQ